jgi:hypothetical protein
MKNIEDLKKQVKLTASIISTFVIAAGFIFIVAYDILVREIISQQHTFSILFLALWLIFVLVVVNIMNIGMAIISIGDSDLVKVAFPVAVPVGVATLLRLGVELQRWRGANVSLFTAE